MLKTFLQDGQMYISFVSNMLPLATRLMKRNSALQWGQSGMSFVSMIFTLATTLFSGGDGIRGAEYRFAGDPIQTA